MQSSDEEVENKTHTPTLGENFGGVTRPYRQNKEKPVSGLHQSELVLKWILPRCDLCHSFFSESLVTRSAMRVELGVAFH